MPLPSASPETSTKCQRRISYPTIQAELFPASVRVSGIGFAHQIVIAVFGGTAPLIAAAFVGAGQPMFVAVYMIAIVALCLVVYFTLPETGSRGGRATVAPADPEVLKGEHLLVETPHSGMQAHNSKP
ncbi:MFS transporter [Pseudarthrobacter sp. LT1]|uniref:MFS transporter n=1 Tax=Pseudarthrobacter sp. LT1 TaxID=3111450 RepID=UPI002D792869|nr:MFS transporter [Pseudarthrobacter sp. LT1]WRT15760.1 MFS transporter [Pseudarthrobacter sp. LT1]